MKDDDAFLHYLDAHPDDRETLLVYADWLDDHADDARAEFLRLQDRVWGMRHRQTGFSVQSKLLLRLGKKLPPAWLAVVSRPLVRGTCWTGTDTPYTWRFLPGGVLNYTSPSGTFQNGTWHQIGNHVAWETNRHFADYDGFIGGDWLHGKASNVSGQRWSFRLQRTDDPVECDPGKPNTTVYDDHLRERPKRGRRRR